MTDRLFDVSNKVVVVTGVSGQLGTGLCRCIPREGAKVVGLDLSESTVVTELAAKHSDSFLFLRADVTIKASLQAALTRITSHFGVPCVLINNAAIDSPPSALPEENGRFEDYPEESWDKVLNVNLKGIFLSCRAFGGEMAKHGRGSIINVASIYGVVAPDQSLYEYRRNRGEVFYKPVAYSASKIRRFEFKPLFSSLLGKRVGP